MDPKKLNAFDFWLLSNIFEQLLFSKMQEQAQAICKVLSTAFDSVLTSEKSWISTAALHMERKDYAQTVANEEKYFEMEDVNLFF